MGLRHGCNYDSTLHDGGTEDSDNKAMAQKRSSMVAVRGGGKGKGFLYIMIGHEEVGGSSGLSTCDASFAGFQGEQPYCSFLVMFWGGACWI